MAGEPQPRSGDEAVAAAAAAAEAVKDQERAQELARDYAQMHDVDELVFGRPKGADGPAQEVWDRYWTAKEGLPFARQVFLATGMRQSQELVKLDIERAQGAARVTLETRSSLHRYQRMLAGVGQALKVQETAHNVPSSTEAAARTDVMEPEEAVQLAQFADFLARIDTKEVFAMSVEDDDYVTMLVQEIAADHRSVVDLQTRRTQEAIPRALENPPSSTALLSLDNPDADKNYARLVKFILGEAEPDSAPKSKERRRTEAVLWLEIVRALDIDQRQRLIEVAIEERGVDKAKEIIRTCVAQGAMHREEVETMHTEALEQHQGVGNIGILAAIDDAFIKDLQSAVEEFEQAKKERRVDAQNLEDPQIQSFVTYLGTFYKLLMSRGSEMLALMGAMNFGLGVAKGITDRREGGKDHGIIHGALSGALKSLRNGYVWAGFGGAALAFNEVIPFIHNWSHEPSAAERERVGKHYAARGFQETFQGRPAFADDFTRQYPDLLAKADHNARNPREKLKDDQDGFWLYPDDISVTPEQVRAWGFRTREQATSAMIGLFNIAANKNFLNLRNRDDLEHYLHEKVFVDSTPIAVIREDGKLERPTQQYNT